MYTVFILLVITAVLFSACGESSASQAQGVAALSTDIEILEAAVEIEPDPHAAALSIFEMLERDVPEKLTVDGLAEHYGLAAEYFTDFAVFRSTAERGLADIAIIRPAPDRRDDVRERLLSYRDARMDEFRNYDILDAYAISGNAIIFNQGYYVVMFMLTDNELAQDILDTYISPNTSNG